MKGDSTLPNKQLLSKNAWSKLKCKEVDDAEGGIITRSKKHKKLLSGKCKLNDMGNNSP